MPMFVLRLMKHSNIKKEKNLSHGSRKTRHRKASVKDAVERSELRCFHAGSGTLRRGTVRHGTVRCVAVRRLGLIKRIDYRLGVFTPGCVVVRRMPASCRAVSYRTVPRRNVPNRVWREPEEATAAGHLA